MPSFGINGSISTGKRTTDSSGTFNNTTTSTLPEWGVTPVQGAAARIGGLLNYKPADLTAPAHDLQRRAAADTTDLGGYDGNFGLATDVTRGVADTSWLQPHLHTNAPFASGGKAYDYVRQYERNINDLLGAHEAEFDAHAGQVRAQQALDLAGAGAFGGSGAALTQSMTEGELARGRASTLSGLRSRAFESALSAAAGDADRATQARISNANTALQDQAQKVGFGFQARGLQMNAANQLGALATGLDANRRANIDARAAQGGVLRGIDQAQRDAPFTSVERIVASLNGLPLSLFGVKNEQGVETKHSVEKSKDVKVGGEVGW
ncbi:hypothetical protein [Phenylobacterium sp.]|uniref:hypothetical protein n=1 Tax=Phenylobacterium sp. TaxID=1871053 RepID=UPI003D2A3077